MECNICENGLVTAKGIFEYDRHPYYLTVAFTKASPAGSPGANLQIEVWEDTNDGPGVDGETVLLEADMPIKYCPECGRKLYKDKVLKKYLVALAVGGVMEQPSFNYQDIGIIEAATPKDASQIYNKKHSCSYFYGATIGEIIDEDALKKELSRGIRPDIVELYRKGYIIAPY